MPLPRQPFSALFILTGLLWTLCGEQAFGAKALPHLEGPAWYAGELRLERESYHARLHLGPCGSFVLHEELVLSRGKVSGWEQTGTWHQIRGGAFVQLSSPSGLYRMLNVGSGGNIYLGAQFSSGELRTVVLRPCPAAPVAFSLSGLLRSQDKAVLLEDSASGLVYRSLPGETLTALLADSPLAEHGALPVRATVTTGSCSGSLPEVHVRDIQRIPPEKKRASRDLGVDFLKNVADGTWQSTRVGNGTPGDAFRLRFVPGRVRTEGRVECFDGSRWLTGSYTLWNAELSLSISDNKSPVAALLARVNAWRLAGEVLELRNGYERLALLEQLR